MATLATGYGEAGADRGGQWRESTTVRRAGHQHGTQTLKRRVYLVVLAVAIAAMTVLMAMHGFTDPMLSVLHPALATFAALVLVIVWKRWVALRTAELTVLATASAVLFGALTWQFVLAPGDNPAQQIATMLWVTVLFPMSFLAFGARRGLVASVAALGAFVALVGPQAWDVYRCDATAPGICVIFVNIAAMFAMLIALLWVLATGYELLITARIEAETRGRQAATDPLTGVANRRRLDDELGRAVAHARRHGEPLSVAIVDIDHFKSVNDRHGHERGDEALREVTRRLAERLRAEDLLGRWGGEEFVLVLPGSDATDARAVAERCRQAIRAAPLSEVGTITASFGVAALTRTETREALLRRADAALYAAKRGGRDRVEVAQGQDAEFHDAQDVEPSHPSDPGLGPMAAS